MGCSPGYCILHRVHSHYCAHQLNIDPKETQINTTDVYIFLFKLSSKSKSQDAFELGKNILPVNNFDHQRRKQKSSSATVMCEEQYCEEHPAILGELMSNSLQ